MGLNHNSQFQIPPLRAIRSQIYGLNTVLLRLFPPFPLFWSCRKPALISTAVRELGLSTKGCKFPTGAEQRFAEERIVALRATRERLLVLQRGQMRVSWGCSPSCCQTPPPQPGVYTHPCCATAWMQKLAPPWVIQKEVVSSWAVLVRADSGSLCVTGPTLVQTKCKKCAANLGVKTQIHKCNHLPKFNELWFQISILGKTTDERDIIWRVYCTGL